MDRQHNIQCLLVQDAPFYILAFERWRIINKKTLLFTIQNVSDLIFYVELCMYIVYIFHLSISQAAMQ
jgi:hypothetical protein